MLQRSQKGRTKVSFGFKTKKVVGDFDRSSFINVVASKCSFQWFKEPVRDE